MYEKNSGLILCEFCPFQIEKILNFCDDMDMGDTMSIRIETVQE